MTSSGDFNVPVAAALVLGGIAALLLATFIALGGYGHRRGDNRTPSVNASSVSNVLPAGGARPDAEVEYLLDTSEPTPSSAPRNP